MRPAWQKRIRLASWLVSAFGDAPDAVGSHCRTFILVTWEVTCAHETTCMNTLLHGLESRPDALLRNLAFGRSVSCVSPERVWRSQSSSKPWFRRAQEPGINRASLRTLRSAIQLQDAAARCVIVRRDKHFIFSCASLLWAAKASFRCSFQKDSDFATLPVSCSRHPAFDSAAGCRCKRI